MDFMPEGMEAVRACLDGIDRNAPVTVEPAAAIRQPIRLISTPSPWLATFRLPQKIMGVLSPARPTSHTAASRRPLAWPSELLPALFVGLCIRYDALRSTAKWGS
jgi:hypothetical protein